VKLSFALAALQELFRHAVFLKFMHHVHQAAGMPHIICNALLACLLGCSAPAFYMQQLCHVSIAGFLHVQACGRSGVCCVECICCSGFLLPKVMP
jgi:hypothetical protein